MAVSPYSPSTGLTAEAIVGALVDPLMGIAVEPGSIRLHPSAPSALSLYDGSLTGLGIGAGLLLTSGKAPGLTNTVGWYGQDNSPVSGYFNGDADVDAAVNRVFQTKSYDATSLAFDFRVTDPNASSISFDLVFGSDEYPEWVNAFVDGAVVIINGVNYALFDQNPDRPLSVIAPNLAAGYFQNNAGSVLPVEYDGVSRSLRIVAPILTGGALNTIKIAIADTGDHIYDSGLFISGMRAGTSPGQGLVVRPPTVCTDGSDYVTGGSTGESLDLLAGDDHCYAAGGSDIVDGGFGNDFIDSGSGDDYLKGGDGDDTLHGGIGQDVAIYDGSSSAYQISTDALSGITTVVALPGAAVPGGSDQLSGIETLQFADGLIQLGGTGPGPALPPPAPVVVDSPGILVVTGVGAVGQILTAELSDADGIADPVTWSWEFQAAGTSTWQAISGATEATYTLTLNEAGGAVRAAALYTDGKGTVSQPLSAAKGIQELETGDALVDLMTLDAPAGAGVKTPLTTVLTRLIELGVSPAQANLKLAAVLGLPADLKLHTYNALQLLQQPTTAYDPVAIKVEVVSLQLAVIASINNDDTAGKLALSLLQAADQGKVLNLADAADVAGLLGVAMPPIGIPAIVSKILYTTGSFAGKLDFKPVPDKPDLLPALLSDWHDFLIVNPGIFPPTLADLSIDMNVAPIGYGTAKLGSGVLNQPYAITPAQLLQGFSDDDFDPLSVSNITVNGGGQLQAQADGNWLFLPDSGFTGPVEISYQVDDGQGASIAGQQMFVVKPPNNAPTGAVMIDGATNPLQATAATQGTTLTLSHSLHDADGLGLPTVSWTADGVLIPGANGFSFTPTQAEVGRVIRGRLSYIDGLSYEESVESLPTLPVANINDPVSGTVSISGTPEQGQTLVASAALADPDGLGTISYRWFADGVLIPTGNGGNGGGGGGGNGSTLVLTQAQVGRQITAEASFTDGFGQREAVFSAPTAPVTNINDAPVGSVSIDGPVSVGIPLLAVANLQDADGLGAFSHQWFADGVPVEGATGPSLMLTTGLLGRSISVRVSYTDGFGQLESVTSGTTAPVVTPVAVNATGTAGNDRMLGTALADQLRGLAGDDTLIAYAGADLLIGGDGLDRMEGGEGDDLYIIERVSDHRDAEVVDRGTNGVDEIRVTETTTGTLTLYAGDLGLERAVIGTGTAATPVSTGVVSVNIDAALAPNGLTLVGNAGVNLLVGSAYDDSISGGAGRDDMRGGGGNDTYIVDNALDAVTEGLNQGIDRVQTTLTHVLSANVEHLELTGTGAINGTGNALANRILGNAARNVIDGGAGADSLDGGAGADLYLIVDAADHPAGEVISDSGSVATEVDEVRFSSTTSGTLTLRSGDTGFEQVVIGTGTAVAAVTTGRAALNVNASAADKALILGGNDGDNSITGTAFDDRIQARLGNDTITGGSGRDTIIFDTALNGTSNVDRLADFQSGVDRIQLKSSVFTGTGAVGATLSAAVFRAAAGATSGGDADDRIIFNTTTGQLFYDSDGNGRRASVLFAQLQPNSIVSLLGASDFQVIA